jgi:hypothetical protein
MQSGNVLTLLTKEDERDHLCPSECSVPCGRRASSATSPAFLYYGSIQALQLHSVDTKERYVLEEINKICTACFYIEINFKSAVSQNSTNEYSVFTVRKKPHFFISLN